VAIGLVALGLFLYREVPEMVRRQIYNDPVPLIVSDKSKVHLRQVAYLPMTQFAYRTFLPADVPYEICVGVSSQDEMFPEPIEVRRLEMDSSTREIMITGTCFQPLDTKAEEKTFLIEMERRASFISWNDPRILTTIPMKGMTSGSTARQVGFAATQSFTGDQPIVLYRQLWRKKGSTGDSGISSTDFQKPGKGLIVWLRPEISKPKE